MPNPFARVTRDAEPSDARKGTLFRLHPLRKGERQLVCEVTSVSKRYGAVSYRALDTARPTYRMDREEFLRRAFPLLDQRRDQHMPAQVAVDRMRGKASAADVESARVTPEAEAEARARLAALPERRPSSIEEIREALRDVEPDVGGYGSDDADWY